MGIENDLYDKELKKFDHFVAFFHKISRAASVWACCLAFWRWIKEELSFYSVLYLFDY